jgi:hypothetical protein
MCIEYVDSNVNNFLTLIVTFCWLLVLKKVLFPWNEHNLSKVTFMTLYLIHELVVDFVRSVLAVMIECVNKAVVYT